jgi:membrane AbrB-like protein
MRLPDRRVLRRLAETLAIGVAGGAMLGVPGFPAGWMSGSIVAVTVCAIAGRPLLFPNGLAMVVFVVIGMSLGAAVTPDTVKLMAAWPLSLAALAVSMTILTASVTLYLRVVHGWDALSALFAAAPGGLAQALALAAQCGCDVRSVAMVQSVRILLLTVIMPVALASFAATGTAPLSGGRSALLDAPGELALLVVACTLAAGLAYRARVPGGLIVGAMTASGLLHGSGIVHVSLPSPIVIASFVMTGAMIGSRFVGTNLTLLLRLLRVGLGALAVGAVAAVGCAILVAWLLSLRTGDVVMAYAPGGLEAMTILSFALHLDPAFVGVHHLARFLFVSLAIPIAVRVLSRSGGPARRNDDIGRR